MMKLKEVNVSDIVDIIYKKNLGKNIFLFVMGMLGAAFAFNLFYEPYSVIPTGSSGLGLIISKVTNTDSSVVMLFLNLSLLVLGLFVFGYDYALKNLAITILYPSFIKATTLITRFIDFEDTSLFLIMIIGGTLTGFSLGLIKKSGFNTGGFCPVYDLFNKIFHISYGNASIIINIVLIIISAFTFGINNAIYAIISLIVSSYMVDRVIIGISNNKVFYIITNKPDDLKAAIMNKLNYMVTIVNARGGYTNKKRKMLMCVVPTIEYLKLKDLVSIIDNEAFFLIVDAYESSVKKNCKYL